MLSFQVCNVGISSVYRNPASLAIRRLVQRVNIGPKPEGWVEQHPVTGQPVNGT